MFSDHRGLTGLNPIIFEEPTIERKAERNGIEDARFALGGKAIVSVEIMQHLADLLVFIQLIRKPLKRDVIFVNENNDLQFASLNFRPNQP